MEDQTPPTPPRSSRRAGLVGGIVGSVGLAAALLTLTATAGADETPTLEAPVSDAPTEAVEAIDADEFPGEEEWAAYDACIDAVFEKNGFDFDEVFEIDDAQLLDGEIDFDEMDFGPEVSIFDGDELSFAEFGEGDGSVTITKSGDDLTITSEGDVDVEEVDWNEAIMLDEFDAELAEGDIELLEGFDDAAFEALDEELASCEDQLPEGIDLVDEFDLDELEEFDEDMLDDDEDAVAAN